MFDLLRLWSGLLIRLVRSRGTLLIENLALRQQLAVFKRQNSRPRLATADKIFWVLLLRSWSLWKTTLVVVSPDTVVRWHRAGFQWYWRFISRVRKHVGRRPVTKEIRELIFQMVAENPTWRAPRIHGELAMLGFDVSERSVSRWMQRAPRTAESGQRWLIFLRNHREAIAAMDFFSVPTVTFNVLYVFFIVGHDRRRIPHFNVTRHPTSVWIVQQLREAFPYEPATKFLILDHDAKYGAEVPGAIRLMNIATVRTAVGCPWQNGVAERWVGSCRRELLDHVIAINQSHLKRLLAPHTLNTTSGIAPIADFRSRLRKGECAAQGEGKLVAACRWPSPSLRTHSVMRRCAGFGPLGWAELCAHYSGSPIVFVAVWMDFFSNFGESNRGIRLRYYWCGSSVLTYLAASPASCDHRSSSAARACEDPVGNRWPER
jgi:putative transposase